MAKSYSQPDGNNDLRHNIDNPDDELKRIIEELGTENKSESKNAHEKTSTSITDIEAAYSVFGLNANASTEDLKIKYKQLIKEYHPDKVDSLGEELKALALNKTNQINQAYQMIRKHKGF